MFAYSGTAWKKCEEFHGIDVVCVRIVECVDGLAEVTPVCVCVGLSTLSFGPLCVCVYVSVFLLLHLRFYTTTFNSNPGKEKKMMRLADTTDAVFAATFSSCASTTSVTNVRRVIEALSTRSPLFGYSFVIPFFSVTHKM